MTTHPVHSRSRALALAAALSMALAGCGSTVQTTGLRSGADGSAGSGLSPADGSGLGVAGAPGSTGTGSASALAATGGTAQPAGVTAGDGSVPSTAGDLPATAIGAGATAPGVTNDSVYIGVTIAKNADAANAAIGAAVKSGDKRQEFEVVLKDVNAHRAPGVRKLVPVYFEYDANSTATADQLGQQACSTFTEDNKVFVALGALTQNEMSCLMKAGASVASDALASGADAMTYRTYPYYYEMGSPNLDRDMLAEIQSLQRQKYFAPWDTSQGALAVAGTTKVGVLTINNPAYNRMVAHTMLPALKRAGYAADVVSVDQPQSNSDLGKMSAQVSAAVLKFRSDNVDHVMITDGGGNLTLLFMENANSQHYQPRYGGDSNNAYQALVDSAAMPTSQLQGAMGAGWDPAIDLPRADSDPQGPYGNTAARTCLARYTKAGVTFSDANSQGIGLLVCNQVDFVAQRVAAIGRQLDRETFRKSVEGLGATYISASHQRMEFSAIRHDGMGVYWDMQWNTSCSCVKYVNGPAGAHTF